MVYQSRIKSATRRTTLVLVFLCLCGIHTFASADNSTANTATEPAAQQQPSPTPSVAPSAAMSPATDKMSQSQQGRQYGQPGFVGEPINLNVVNADIRDILNYITEQYGVNFVIDSSVAAVPVTVNVQDVPWNIALDAVLKANRLGVETSGNILRVATNEVLAKESETQKVINDSRLDASPLVTEFIRLNYARASGTLAQAAGSTGAFSGGATNLSFSGGAGGDATGGSGDQGLLPIISRRLSRRGSIEVDGHDVTKLPMYRRARLGIGYLPQEASIFRGLTAEQNIRATAELLEPDGARLEAMVEALLAEFGITHIRNTPAVALSGGERRRVEIARCLATHPSYILLDEPFAGIDPIAVGEIRDLVKHLKDRGIGVLITDHNVRDALDVIDRAYILHDGRVLREGTPTEIVADRDVRRVYLGEKFSL